MKYRILRIISDRHKKSTIPMKQLHENSAYAPSGTRTLDTLIKSQVLYQLS